jgi:hypothetical protein
VGEHKRLKPSLSLEERLAERAAVFKEQADRLPAGEEREDLLRKAHLVENGAHLNAWLTSPERGPLGEQNSHPSRHRNDIGRKA